MGVIFVISYMQFPYHNPYQSIAGVIFHVKVIFLDKRTIANYLNTWTKNLMLTQWILKCQHKILTTSDFVSSLQALSVSPPAASYGRSDGTMVCRTRPDRWVRTVFRWRQWANPETHTINNTMVCRTRPDRWVRTVFRWRQWANPETHLYNQQ